MHHSEQIRALINRLGRLDAAQVWDGALNPAQRAALDYLARANRFSRAPSQVAEFLGTTRGTASQTLKALLRKGFVTEGRSAIDKRWVSFQVTAAGRAEAGTETRLVAAITDTPPEDLAVLEGALRRLLHAALRQNGSKPFGICRTCRHFRPSPSGGTCALLRVALSEVETGQICHEHQVAA